MANKEKIKKALGNPTLRRALTNFGNNYVLAREKVFAGLDFEELRREIKAARTEVRKKLDFYVEQFRINAEKNGARVIIVHSAAEAKKAIVDILKAKNAKTVVKSKSMASEEIHLNEELVKHGIEVVETDLGEWILQLDGQKPSHMVMPAIHLTREEVAAIFSRALDREVAPDIAQMVKLARQELRDKFLKADVGITGGNIAVAETGSIFLFTNEGNARLTTTLPRVRISLVGVEKIVPTLKDAIPIMRALPRNATAQKITSYVTVMTAGAGQEHYVILMDNGRIELKDDPVFAELFQCIRCAGCLNVCPVYQQVGGHVFGHVYTGPIGTLLTAFFHGLDAAKDPQALCGSCLRCATVCPAGINLPELLLKLRQRVVESYGQPFVQKFIFERILANPKLFNSLLDLGRKFQGLIAENGEIKSLPFGLDNLTSFRVFPALAKERLYKKYRVRPKKKGTRGKVLFYSGCLIEHMYPDIGEDVFLVLEKNGYEVVLPEDLGCCGAPAYYSGDLQAAVRMAKNNIEAFLKHEYDYIVTACPTCSETLMHYEKYLEDDEEYREKAREVSRKVIDFTDFAYKYLAVGEGKLAGSYTLHDSCHARRGLGQVKEPRELIVKTGANLVEMANSDQCCGFGGSFSIKYPEISEKVFQNKYQSIMETGAEKVAVTCPGCLMQIAGGLKKQGAPVKVEHLATILAKTFRDGSENHHFLR
ncbi:L-lactate dehydrogenase (quinone) large subunit LdhH [Carboxydothermus hydrogenoformans]|uniref:Iron-sulfur cluster binding protein n=1 Tax=Carboxydothermus hydrogenoformans (strain ATCC BAA-161 / DSM 6008 / Z-2901) TaxID=246194 RepID=Q3AEY7_CARHZ|nr:LUD domain-containing protein [Carboxydothermus hydrogenoformans]ABB15109.1 iron-sulfur cluster binding protein [Carboxydothermus hydrogenoformans Z-2901]